MYFIKLGGSLLTHKDKYCTPNYELLDAYAKTLSIHWPKLIGQLVLVIGGGSFGNGVPLKYHLYDSTAPWEPKNIMNMTTKMFEWLSTVVGMLKKYGLPGYPFQASSWITTKSGVPDKISINPILQALKLGLLPVLSGDLVFDSHKSFVIFSSDNIPQIFVNSLPIQRVGILTNVPGVLINPMCNNSIVQHVTESNMKEVLNITGPSNHGDVTGGMRNKLLAAINLADSGVESVICDGRNPEVLSEVLFNLHPPGTVVRFVNNSKPERWDS